MRKTTDPPQTLPMFPHHAPARDQPVKHDKTKYPTIISQTYIHELCKYLYLDSPRLSLPVREVHAGLPTIAVAAPTPALFPPVPA